MKTISLSKALEQKGSLSQAKIKLSDNQLPIEIFELAELRTLILILPNAKDLTGPWSKLPFLREVYITAAQVEVLTEDLFFAPRLKKFSFKEGQLREVCLPKLNHALESLSLDRQQLEALPQGIEALESLKLLSLGQNKIKILTPELLSLKNLEWLNLDGNLLKQAPLFLKNHPKLKHLSIDFNAWDDEQLSLIQQELHLHPQL